MMRDGCTRGAFDRAPFIVIWETTRDRCGGSRARAFAASGDPLGEDPEFIWPAGPGASAP